MQPKFAGTDFEVVKNMCGALSEKESGFRNVYHHAMTAEEINALPENFDSREAWPMCVSIKEVRDQSDCGSCWAFGAAEAASDRICIASKGVLQPKISTENLVSCCKSCGFGCNGGYPIDAWRYLAETGVPTGGLYGDKGTCQPYSMPPCDHHVTGKYGPCTTEYATPNCRHTCDSDSEVTDTYSEEIETFRFSKAYHVSSNVHQIQKEIMTNGPVEGAFTVYADFETYKSGVYQHKKGSYLGGHAIKVLGWGVEDGTPYWLCANSWNEGWGDDGFFKILRGKNHCGIEGGIVGGNFAFTGSKSGNLRIDSFFDDA